MFKQNLARNMILSPVIALMTLPALAQAADQIQPINDLATSILNFLTGPLARAVAAIAVVFLGYAMMTGRIERSRALAVIFGIIIVFGGVTIVTWLDSVA